MCTEATDPLPGGDVGNIHKCEGVMERVIAGGGKQGHGVGWTNTKLSPDEPLQLCHTHPSRALQITDSVFLGIL